MYRQNRCNLEIQTDTDWRPINQLKMYSSIPKTATQWEMDDAIEKWYIQDLTMNSAFISVNTEESLSATKEKKGFHIRTSVFQRSPDWRRVLHKKYIGARCSRCCFNQTLAGSPVSCCCYGLGFTTSAVVTGQGYWWYLAGCGYLSALVIPCLYLHHYCTTQQQNN